MEEPEEVVFVCDLHVFVFCFSEGFGDADWGGEADGVRIFGGFVEEDAGVAVGDDHFQAEQEFCFDFVKAGAGIEIVDHVVDHKKGVFSMVFSFFGTVVAVFSYKEIRVMDMQWIVTVMFVLFLDKSYWFSRFVSTDFI